jgi:hypothetical protein
MCQNGTYAIYCNPSYGPTFGCGHEIYISSSSNLNQKSFSYFGASFKHPDYQFGTEKSRSILAGSFQFLTLEIEVFTQKN